MGGQPDVGRQATPQLSGGGLLLPPPFFSSSCELAGAGLVPRALPYKAKKCWKAAVIRGGRGPASPGAGERGWDGAGPSNQAVSQPWALLLPSLFCKGVEEGLGQPPIDQGEGPALPTKADELGLVCPPPKSQQDLRWGLGGKPWLILCSWSSPNLPFIPSLKPLLHHIHLVLGDRIRQGCRARTPQSRSGEAASLCAAQLVLEACLLDAEAATARPFRVSIPFPPSR